MNKSLIISRAGKAKGKNNSWFNVKDITQDKHISVEFSKIKGWKNTEEVLIVEILQAKQSEINSWVKHNLNEEVEDKN